MLIEPLWFEVSCSYLVYLDPFVCFSGEDAWRCVLLELFFHEFVSWLQIMPDSWSSFMLFLADIKVVFINSSCSSVFCFVFFFFYPTATLRALNKPHG